MKGLRKLIIFLAASIVFITGSFYVYQICYTPNVLVGEVDRELIIPEDATFKTIQDQLHAGNYVRDLISFSFLAKLMDYDELIKPGRYVLKANMNNITAVRFLRAGIQQPVNITFNNVRLLSELSEKIVRNTGMKSEEFDTALIKFAMNNPYGFNKDNVMCMFIPNTYEVYYNVAPDRLVERMYNEYKNFWNEERAQKASAIGLTPVEVSILASIVQAEAVKQEEAPTIAGLYINRLKQGVALQADPTLVFAVGDFALKRVLNEHKEVDSPYNTYKNLGLPPGPINNPRVNCIDAVLNYLPSDYIYMCAKEDFSGRHNFTSSYKQHMDNAIRYQRALTIEQQKGRAAAAR